MSSDFWSRRKAAVQAEEREDVRRADEQAAEQREAELADLSDAEILEDLGLPDPDTLGEGDDFKVFLTEAVPARIRTRALRKLWMTNPILANVDGLVDYGEDFTDASCVIENLQTAYQVGKGMTEHVLELARQAEAEADAAPETPEDIEDEAQPETEEPQVLTAASPAPAPILNTTPEEAEDAPLPPRRMRFAFDDTGAPA